MESTSDTEQLVRAPYPYKANYVKVISVLQILIGSLCIGVDIALIYLSSKTLPPGPLEFYYVRNLGCSTVAYGIWCGIFYIITGSFGVVSANRENRGPILVGTFCVLSTVTVLLFVVPIFTFGGVNLGFDINDKMESLYDPETGILYQISTKYWIPRIVLDSCLLFLASLEFWFSLWSAIITWIYIKKNYMKEDDISTETVAPRRKLNQPPSGWYIMTGPSGDPQLINSDQLAVYQGPPIPIQMGSQSQATSGVVNTEEEDSYHHEDDA